MFLNFYLFKILFLFTFLFNKTNGVLQEEHSVDKFLQFLHEISHG